ncbi:MAG: glycosyltransferase family 39 protein [Nanoarchaeota archaeon]|nr:glycosyltransferase family 39 protein [Nanoarchaeota archaeon]
MKHHSKYFIKHLAHGFAILFVIVLFLHFNKSIPGYWGDKTIYFFYISLVFGTIFAAFEIYEISQDERENSYFIQGISYAFLFSLLVIVVHQFLNLAIIQSFKLELVSLSISLGILTFYANHDSVWKKLETERNTEQEVENRRKDHFNKGYPGISRIPLLGSLVRWFYKEGWLYSIGLLLIIILAFALRVWQVGKLGLQVDEQFAYSVGLNLINKFQFLIFNTDFYYRGWPYSILVAISFFFLGVSEFSLRLPGVVLGSLTIIPLYSIIKKVTNKKCAIFASLLLAVFSWHIYYSRWGRHYVLASFLLILSLNYTYLFFNSEFKSYRYKSILSTALLVLTLKELLIVPVIYLVLIAIIKRFRINPLKELFLFLGYIVPICLTLFIPEKITGARGGSSEIVIPDALLFQVIKWVQSWLSYSTYKYYFLGKLYNLMPILIVLTILFCLALILSSRKNKGIIVLITPLVIFILMNVIGRHKPWNIRQISFLMPFFIIVLIYFFAIMKKNKYSSIVILSSILIISINPYYMGMVYSIDYGTPLKNTLFELTSAENSYPDYKTPVEYIVSNKEDGDIIIRDPSISEAYLYGNMAYSFTDLNEDRNMVMIEELLNTNKRVWILNTVINDERFHYKTRNGKVRQFLDKNEDKVVYIGKDKISKVYLFTDFKNTTEV